MKRILITLLILVVLLGAGAYFGGFLDPMLGRGQDATNVEASQTQAGDAAAAAQPVVDTSNVVADARVIPVQSAQLSMPIGGIVEEILVDEGALVEEDQLLLRLDASTQQTAVRRAEADLQRAQARLAELTAGARSQEIDQARASLAAAEAQLQRIQEGNVPGDVAVAEANVAGAQANLQKVFEGASEQALINAKANLANAEAEMRRAQRAYNEVSWRNDVGALPQAAALETATNNFAAAQAQYADLTAGPRNADIAAARAEIERTQAQLETITKTLPADVAAAQAEVDRARAQVELLEAGTRPEEIQSAEADVAAAVASLQQALVALADTELRAPFAGTVASLDIEEGEQLAAGTPIVRMAQLGNWEIRTEDLTEFQIVGIQPGDTAEIAFDAIPDLLINGVVDRIRPIGADLRGDIVYTVVVIPTESDDRIMWNMTAVTTFDRE